MLNNEQNNNNMYGPDELALNQDIQMSNVVTNDINNNIKLLIFIGLLMIKIILNHYFDFNTKIN